MPTAPDIDFQRIRPHRGDQRMGFEELMRQLLVARPPADCVAMEHKGPGADGGVETLVQLTGGRQWGYQSKYFPVVFGSSQINQILSSFESAMATYPNLVGYTVALPRNLSASGNPEQTTKRDLWEAFVVKAEGKAAAAGRMIEIALWDETGLVQSLSRSGAIFDGMRAYWFDETVLTRDWFQTRFDIVEADLGDRYHASDHVDVTAQLGLDTLAREPSFHDLMSRHRRNLTSLSAALAAVEPMVPASTAALTDLADFRGALDDLATEAAALPFEAPASLDIGEHLQALTTLMRAPALQRFRDAGYPPSDETGDAREARLQAGFAFREALSDLDESRRSLPAQVLKEHRLLLVGEAGAGKSHSLAHMVGHHVQQGFPALMMLGQMFASGDPRSQIVSHLSLGSLPFGTFLGALHAAAGASGRPALIVIDALNESRDKTLWRTALAGLATEIAKFDRLALIVSCRDVYEKACIPPTLALHRFRHRGFEGDGAAAAKAYLDRKGIDRPSTPFLDAEFTNPLFLTTCVHRLHAEGKTAFPVGLDGITQLFDFWIEGVEHTLVARGYQRITPGDGRVRAALNAFADELALRSVDALPFADARALFETTVAGYASDGPADDLVFRLIAEGVLRRTPLGATAVEEVSFTFQRFSDYFVADALLRLFDTPSTLATALKSGGDLQHIFAADWGNEGVIEALWVQVAERHGLELVDLEPGFNTAVRLRLDLFLRSLRWRDPAAVSARAVAVFEKAWDTTPAKRGALLDTLLQVASQPGHALNADYLHARLDALKMPDRDAVLGENLRNDEEDGPVEILIDWAMCSRHALTEADRVRLATSALSWFLSSSNRVLRDRTSRAITRILRARPELICELLDRFAGVDDAYVRERILAAAYAAVLGLKKTDGVLRDVADAVWRMVFAPRPVERHAFVRHFARGIIELANTRGLLPTTASLQGARPPYKSCPITQWPTIHDLALLRDNALDIVSSVLGYFAEDKGRFTMPGDFGNYTMGSLGADFTATPLTRTPESEGVVRERLWKTLRSKPAPLPELVERALKARLAADMAREGEFELLINSATRPRSRKRNDIASADAAFDAAHEALEAALTPDDLPEGYLPYPAHDDDRPAAFGQGKARRWVAARAIELGWSKAKHGAIEQYHSGRGGRHEHEIERVGKKYQWIAYHELIGHLADHHWRIHWREEPVVLQDVLEIEDLDIDLSYDGLDMSRLPKGLPELGLLQTDISAPMTVEAGVSWSEGPDDLPNIPGAAERKGEDGTRWWLVSSFRRDSGYMDKLQSNGPMRTGQNQILLVILRAADVQPFYERVTRASCDLNEICEDQHARSRLYGEYRAEIAPTEPLLDYKFLRTQVGRISQGFTPGRGEYDFGGVKEGSFDVPRAALLRGLNLRPASPSEPWFVDGDEVLTFIDEGVCGGGERPSMVNADRLEPWLSGQGLIPVWRYWGEKDGGMGAGQGFSRRDGKSSRQTFSGIWWKEGGLWKGSTWRARGPRPRGAIV